MSSISLSRRRLKPPANPPVPEAGVQYTFTCDSPEEADQALQFQEVDVLALGESVRKRRGPV